MKNEPNNTHVAYNWIPLEQRVINTMESQHICGWL